MKSDSFSFHHGIDVLNCAQRRHLLGPVDDIYIHLRKTPAPDQALVYEPPHGLRHILHRNCTHPVKIVQVHMVRLQPLHGALQMLPDRLVDVSEWAHPEKQLCGDDHIFPDALQCLAHDPLVVSDAREIGAVHFCRVKESAAVFIGISDGLNTVLFRRNLSVAMGEGHTAHAHRRDCDIAQFSGLHVRSPVCRCRCGWPR